MRIPTLLQKISELSSQPERRTAIEVDLMMDYTRVLYADLMEWRARLPASVSLPPTSTPIKEPTLAEMAEAMEQQQPEVEDEVRTAMPAQTSAIPEREAKQKPQEAAAAPPQAPVTPPPPKIISEDGRDIRGLIGINDKYQILSELFSNDKTAYEQALDFINQSKNENAAMNWLREQLWITEERSDAAQSFFEIVARFFKK